MMMMIAVSKILLSLMFHLLKTNDPISMFHLEFLKKKKYYQGRVSRGLKSYTHICGF